MAEHRYVTLTEQNFAKEVLEAKRPVLVEFWAAWCAPCRAVAPVIEEIARDFEGQATIGKVNVDEESELARRYGIRSIPSLLFFRDGQVVDRLAGVARRSVLAGKLEHLVTAAAA